MEAAALEREEAAQLQLEVEELRELVVENGALRRELERQRIAVEKGQRHALLRPHLGLDSELGLHHEPHPNPNLKTDATQKWQSLKTKAQRQGSGTRTFRARLYKLTLKRIKGRRLVSVSTFHTMPSLVQTKGKVIRSRLESPR